MYKLNNIIYNKNSFIWIMRQAGRYLPEYLKTREQAGDFLNLCYNSELACEVTIQPITRFNFDAAIIFSDILVVLDALDIEVKFIKGKGPVLKGDLKKFSEIELSSIEERINDKLQNIYKAISLVRNELDADKSLIGFSAAFFTLFVYLIEQASSKDYAKAKIFSYNHPEEFLKIKKILIKAISVHLKNQIAAGCDVIKIFDSWAGVVAEDKINSFIIDPTAEILENLKGEKAKKICFPKNIRKNLDKFCELDFDVLALDFNFDIKKAEDIYQKYGKITQGNMDPSFLLANDQNIIKNEIDKIRNATKNIPHIFNLGHGVLPQTPVKNMEFLVEYYRKSFS